MKETITALQAVRRKMVTIDSSKLYSEKAAIMTCIGIVDDHIAAEKKKQKKMNKMLNYTASQYVPKDK